MMLENVNLYTALYAYVHNMVTYDLELCKTLGIFFISAELVLGDALMQTIR